MMKNKRIGWIDSLRGLGMFFVIWGHAYPTNESPIRKFIYSFHMPFFFFLSGINSRKDLELDFKTFLLKKIKTLIVPYFILNIIGIIIHLVLSHFGIVDSVSLVEMLLGIIYSHDIVLPTPLGPTWFFATLFLVQVLFYLINKVARDDRDLFYMTGICALIGYLNSISKYEIYGPWHIESVFTAVFFYFLGYIFMKNVHVFDKLFNKKKLMFVLGVFALFISLFFINGNQRVSMHSNQYGAILSFYIPCLSIIFGLILLVNIFFKKSFIFETIGKNSIFFLCYHNMLFALYRYFFPIFLKNDLYFFILSIIVTIILFPLSFLVPKKLPILLGRVDGLFDKCVNFLNKKFNES